MPSAVTDEEGSLVACTPIVCKRFAPTKLEFAPIQSIAGVTMVVMIMMAMMMMMIIFSTEEVFDQSMVYFSCNLGNILSQTC